MRKSLITIALLLLVAIALAACGGEPAEPKTGSVDCGTETMDIPDLNGDKLTFAVENAYPPFNYLDDSGVGIGWDFDMGRALCEILNCVPVFTLAAWDGIFPAMAAGEYDVLFDGVTFKPERDETVDFSCSYVTLGQLLLVRIDEDRFDSPETFAANEEFLAATQLGTTNYDAAMTFLPTDRIISFEDFPLAVQSVLVGDNDAVVIDTLSAIGFMEVNPGKLKTLETMIISDEKLALVFSPASELTEAFDAALHQMASDGTLDAINDKWFNP